MIRWRIGAILAAFISAAPIIQPQGMPQPSKPPGAMVELGGHRLHVNCTGEGSPTVVIETGFDEFSFDWILVQEKVGKFTRVCTYDRAGYARSDPGPAPRTFAQINLELRDALAKLSERGPFIMVGHLFGGPIVRNFAIAYPGEVAAIVFVEAVSEDQRFSMWKKAILMRDGAKGKTVPAPHEVMVAADKLEIPAFAAGFKVEAIEPQFRRLPPDAQEFHLWASNQQARQAAQENERTWSPEYFARWHDQPGSASLGSIPLIVLTRVSGSFGDGLDIPGAQLESERKQLQSRLVALSKRGKQIMVESGEDMQVEAPQVIVQAIRDALDTARQSK